MRKNIARVLAAFERGTHCVGDARRSCSTDGDTVFSYAMPIAWRDADGNIVIVPYAEGPTRTTRSQIRACEVWIAQSGVVGVAYKALALQGAA